MASYVQLGRGWRPNYQIASLQHRHRRRSGGRGVAATLAVIAVVFAAGLLWGSLNTGSSQVRPASPQPMQYYPR